MHITLESPNQPDVIARLPSWMPIRTACIRPRRVMRWILPRWRVPPCCLPWLATAMVRPWVVLQLCSASAMARSSACMCAHSTGGRAWRVVGAGAGECRSCAGLSCADAGNRALSARGIGVLRPTGLCALRPFWRVPRASAERFHEQATGRAGGQRRIPLLSESLNP